MSVVFVTRLRAAVPLCATFVVSLALAPWPEGDATGRDREVVARVTRGGVQRLEDAVHVDHDVFDASISHRPDGIAAPASAPMVLPVVVGLTAPALPYSVDGARTVPPPQAPPLARPRGRAPPVG